jgi:hypothetical protein
VKDDAYFFVIRFNVLQILTRSIFCWDLGLVDGSELSVKDLAPLVVWVTVFVFEYVNKSLYFPPMGSGLIFWLMFLKLCLFFLALNLLYCAWQRFSVLWSSIIVFLRYFMMDSSSARRYSDSIMSFTSIFQMWVVCITCCLSKNNCKPWYEVPYSKTLSGATSWLLFLAGLIDALTEVVPRVCSLQP